MIDALIVLKLMLVGIGPIRFCAGPLSVIKVLPLSLKLFHQELILHTVRLQLALILASSLARLSAMAYLADTNTPMKISIPQ